MDWNKAKSVAQPAADPPRATLLEICWHLRAPSARVITCSIVRDNAPGLEVRCGFSDDDLLRSQRASEIGSARDVAEGWKRAILAKGSFTEVPTFGINQ
jgi:hypothetical protein